MIERLELQNYKNFKSLTIDGFKRINLISGMNNTGKTSILEAIFMQHDRLAADVTIKPLIWRGLQYFEIKADAIFHPYFHNFNFDLPMRIKISGAGHTSTATYKLTKDKVRNFSIQEFPSHSQSVFDSSGTPNERLEIKYENTGPNKNGGTAYIDLTNGQVNMQVDSVLPSRIPSIYIPASARGNNANDAMAIGKMDIENGLDELLSYLRIIESRLRSISVIPMAGQSVIYGDVSLKRKIPLSQMGEGINKLVSILAAILSQPNGIILIDEIENGIHYSLLPKLWDIIFMAAKRHNSQIFITTHSNDVLKALISYWKSGETETPIEKQSAAFIRLDRASDNEIKPKIYESQTLAAAVERGWDIR